MELKEKLKAATREDLPQILKLYRSVVGAKGCTWDAFYPNEDTLFEDFEAGQLFVLWKDEQMLGAGSIVPENELDDLEYWAFPEKARELARIVIAPEHQGRGYGSLLVQKLCDRLAQTGCKAVHLLVAQENTSAQRMYQKIGFQGKGTCHRYDIDFFAYEKEL